MKKVLVVLVMFFGIAILTSCTDNTEKIAKNEEKIEHFGKIDPIKDCPPNDRNCNGVPDDEE
ncbi:conserved exported protein of unknown function [Tenacibaculum sp. 190130A14a]|uniref:Lipoprotein n=1 Tax=Tenacibaculum polynesiense TaxID=3137857 RepID=A0ABM9P6S5_9FLAO